LRISFPHVAWITGIAQAQRLQMEHLFYHCQVIATAYAAIHETGSNPHDP
jgi:hypothetical protein